MANVSSWDPIAINNSATPPDGWPEGMERDKVNDSARENMGATARWYRDLDGNLLSTGTGNAYVVTTVSNHQSLNDLSLLVFRAHIESSATPTLQVDSLAAKTIKDREGGDLTKGAIKAGQNVVVSYNRGAGNDYFHLLGFIDQLPSVQTFTASGTWAKPSGVRFVVIQVIGAGAGGGGCAANSGSTTSAGAGGGAGGYTEKVIDVDGIASSTITIGAGGVGGLAGANNGSDGGDSTWDDGVNTVTGSGGKGGEGGTGATQVFVGVQGGTGGATTGGDTGAQGSPGGNAAVAPGSNSSSAGFGGSSFFGGGARGDADQAGAARPGNDAGGPGGGGSGAISMNSGAAQAGGKGADGIIIVTEYR